MKKHPSQKKIPRHVWKRHYANMRKNYPLVINLSRRLKKRLNQIKKKDKNFVFLIMPATGSGVTVGMIYPSTRFTKHKVRWRLSQRARRAAKTLDATCKASRSLNREFAGRGTQIMAFRFSPLEGYVFPKALAQFALK